MSASNSASPQRMTSLFTVCQSHPNSSATADTLRHRPPTCQVAHRPARDVNEARCGATERSCSTKDPTPQDGSAHIQRCFRHHSRTGRPNTEKIHQPHRPVTLRPHPPPTYITDRSFRPGPHRNPQRPVAPFLDTYHINNAQAHQQLAHQRRINNHRGPPLIRMSFNTRLWRTPHSHRRNHHSPLISEDPRNLDTETPPVCDRGGKR